MGWDPSGVYSVSSGNGALAVNIFCCVCGVCIVYELFGMDVRQVHSVCSVYEAFGPVIFVAFRVFVAFMGHWGWTLVAFTELDVFRVVGLVVSGV